MISERRVSLPPRPNDKENQTPISRSASKKSLRSHLKTDTEPTSNDIKVVQVENFVDQSLLTHLPVSRQAFEIPVLDQMPSIDLESVHERILTPRDFDEFRREVLLFEDKLFKCYEMRRYVRVQKPIHLQFPKIDWNHQKTLNKSQVIRQNCSNMEYEKFLLTGRRKLSSYVDDVFPPSSAAFYNRGKSHEDKALHLHTWKRLWFSKTQSFSLSNLHQGIYRTENLLSCFLALPIGYQMNLFQGQNFDGKSAFFVKLNKEGIWRYIMIDNFVPYAKGDISFLSGGFPLTLIEKAWAKYLDSYTRLDSIQQQPISQIITDLTGAPSQQIKCSNPRLLLSMKLMLSKKYILIASNNRNSEKRMKVEYQLGIPVDYSYPVEKIDGEYIVLKNVWGCESTSPFVGTEQVRLHINEFKQFFDLVTVNKVFAHGEGYYNNISVRQRKGFYSLIQLSVLEETCGFITLSQIDKLNNLQDYSYCKLILFETYSDTVAYLQEVSSKQKKTTLQVGLSKGQYLILVEMTWLNKQYESTLSILSNRPVELNKLKFNQQNNYLLTLKKQKTQSQRRASASMSASKASRSQKFKPQK